MKFDRMVIVSDIDGTFLSRGKKQRNFEAIEYFKSMGGRFTFSTGRIQYNIRKAMGEYGNICNAPAICANGACIYDFEKDQTLCEKCLSAELASEICIFAQEICPNVGIRCSTEKGFLTNKLFGVIEKDYESFKGGEKAILPFEKWNERKLYKMVCRGDAEELKALRVRLIEHFGDTVCYTSSSPTFLELNAVGCTKAEGVRFLRHLYDKQDEPIKVFAIGDYENDIDMLKAADFAACPDNALDIVKEICDRTFCSCEDGAVADLIEYIDKRTDLHNRS